MPDKVRIARSSTKGARPTGKTAADAGSLYVNYPDRQLGVIDTAGAAVDLLPITAFSATADYAVGALVTNGGNIYRCITAVTAAAWDATKWEAVAKADFTATRVPFADATGALTEDAGLTYTVATKKLTTGGDALINGITVGKGAGTGTNNVAVGNSALAVNTGVGYNTAVGSSALAANTTGAANVGIGYGAMQSNTTGQTNVAVGTSALSANTVGSQNTAIGNGALINSSTNNNTAVGFNSLYLNTTGTPNTAVGSLALSSNTTGTNNVAVGDNALVASTGNNNVAVGSNAGNDALITIIAQSNHVVIGNNSTTNAICKVAWATTSDVREKEIFGEVPHGLEFVNQLPTITYKFKKDRADAHAPADAPMHYGFPAQDILALEGTGVIVNADDPEHLRLNSNSIIPVLVNAIKELSAKVEELKAKVK